MKNSQWIVLGCAIFALLVAGRQTGLAQTPVQVVVQNWSGSATITTANCSGAGGLCQAAAPSPAPTPAQGSGACNNGAGPNPDNITATVTLCEVSASAVIQQLPPPITPNTIFPLVAQTHTGVLTGSGSGTGFRAGATYISLIYKNPNTATCSRFPAGTPAVLQNLLAADSDFGSMFLGFWVRDPEPNPTGHATLQVDKQATIPGLNNYTTLSVREVQPPNTQCYDCGNDPAPQFNALRACGSLTVVPTASCALP